MVKQDSYIKSESRLPLLRFINASSQRYTTSGTHNIVANHLIRNRDGLASSTALDGTTAATTATATTAVTTGKSSTTSSAFTAPGRAAGGIAGGRRTHIIYSNCYI